MQDRIPVNPGRVMISPENGAAYYATMTRADNATQEGTPLNKNSLLRDATAALFGLGADAVPDDVFGVLSRFQNGLGNEYVWAKTKVTEYVAEERFDYTSSSVMLFVASNLPCTIEYSDAVEIKNGEVVLAEPISTITISSAYGTDYEQLNALIGRYFVSQNGWSTGLGYGVKKLTSGTPFVFSSNEFRIDNAVGAHCSAASSAASFGYVNSPDPNAYPVDDGYTYTALGQLGNKVQIATGRYTGTGKAGSGNQNSLTFDFVPKLVIVTTDSGMNGYAFVFGTSRTLGLGGYYSQQCLVTWEGNKLTWYNTSSNADNQLNASGQVYKYFAIG